ncbi:helix-turn-helix domain-containing protein [Streptomyces parvulus]|uniref:helix-turn-helix domain-containing protein n=1 Tax=Streptomyces parvulus TaxID=146923 RepID=UPI0033DC9711
MATNTELREFLRSRRARLQPVDVGIPTGEARRVPGLRREEVAMLAGVSLDYYARLEQGRNLQPSDQVLEAIGRALHLTPLERTHLHDLVRAMVGARVEELPSGPLDSVTEVLVAEMQIPALVLDARGGVQAMNPLARALLIGLEPVPSALASHPRWIFLDPVARELMTDWEMVARSSVGVLRHAAGRYPQDKALHSLIGELAIASTEFPAWWAEHDVSQRCHGPKRFRHPVVGELTLEVETLQLHDGAHWLYAYVAKPGSRSAEALRLLGSWSARGEGDPALPGAAEVLPER